MADNDHNNDDDDNNNDDTVIDYTRSGRRIRTLAWYKDYFFSASRLSESTMTQTKVTECKGTLCDWDEDPRIELK